MKFSWNLKFASKIWNIVILLSDQHLVLQLETYEINIVWYI